MGGIIPVESFDCIVFGATGDLARRKLLPALYHRLRDRQIPADSSVIAVSRTEMTDEGYREMAADALRRHVDAAEYDADEAARFCGMLRYVQGDGRSGEGFGDVAAALAGTEGRVRVFYLATSPELYGSVCRHIAVAGLATARSRIVLEKPVGHDLASALQVNAEVERVFSEAQTFRIDHYLGKETVQNLLALRFANSIFERLWNADVIDHVQITVAETVGVEGRGDYYDGTGALRDMMQNHLLQLVCLLAMECPVSIGADAVRDEKLKVLRSLRPLAGQDGRQFTVRGQYSAGAVGGRPVKGYLEDLGKGRSSLTETFVALKAEVRSQRWAGVPFYLRTGKRMPRKLSEIVVQFRSIPFSIFPPDAASPQPNALVIRLQPEEGMCLRMMTKAPGPGGLRLVPQELRLNFQASFRSRFPDAYERLLMDVVCGNPTLFMRRDEVEAAWAWIDPIALAWADAQMPPRPYAAGSWGPSASIALIERDGRTWHDDS